MNGAIEAKIYVVEGEGGYNGSRSTPPPGGSGGPSSTKKREAEKTLGQKLMGDMPKDMKGIAMFAMKMLPFATAAGLIVGVFKKSQVMQAMSSSFMTIMGAIVDLLLIPLIPIFVPALKILIKFIPVIQKLSEILTPIGEGIGKVVEGISDMLEGKFLEGLGEVLLGTLQAIFPSIDMGKAFNFLEGVDDKIDKFASEGLKAFASWTTNFGKKAGEWLENFFTKVGKTFWEFVTEKIPDFFKGSITTFWNWVSAYIGIFFSTKGALTTFWDFVTERIVPFFGNVAKEGFNFWVMLGERIFRFFGEVAKADFQFWLFVAERIWKFFGSVASIIGNFWDFVSERIVKFFGETLGLVWNFWGYMADSLGKFFTAIPAGFKTLWELIGEAFKEAISRFNPLADGGGGDSEKKTKPPFIPPMIPRMWQSGTSYVPNTGFALLHRGERVVSANDKQYSAGSKIFNITSPITINASGNSDQMAASMKRIFLNDLERSLARVAG